MAQIVEVTAIKNYGSEELFILTILINNHMYPGTSLVKKAMNQTEVGTTAIPAHPIISQLLLTKMMFKLVRL